MEPKEIEEIYDLGASMLIKGYDPELTSHLVKKHVERWRLPYDVFISYSDKDTQVAKELFIKLSQKEPNPFLAQESIGAGEDWSEAVRRALKLSKILILLLTDNSKGRPWVNAEAGAAWSRGKKIISACRGIDINDDAVVSLAKQYQAAKYDTESDTTKMVEDVVKLCQRWSL